MSTMQLNAEGQEIYAFTGSWMGYLTVLIPAAQDGQIVRGSEITVVNAITGEVVAYAAAAGRPTVAADGSRVVKVHDVTTAALEAYGA